MRSVIIREVNFDDFIYNTDMSNDEDVIVTFDDNTTKLLTLRELVIYMIFWKGLVRCNYPITQEYVVDLVPFKGTTIDTLNTFLFEKMLEADPHRLDEIEADRLLAIQELSNFQIRNCRDYAETISYLDFRDVLKDEQFRELLKHKITSIGNYKNSTEAQLAYKANVKKLWDIISNTDNGFSSLVSQNLVDSTQIAHIFYQIGFRSDIDTTLVLRPIVGNYLFGLEDAIAYAIESTTAKISIMNNNSSIANADNTGRRNILGSAGISDIIEGDCGSTTTVTQTVIAATKERYLYKHIVVDGKLVMLTSKNIDEYVDKEIQMRSPRYCRHQGKVCQVCAGALVSVHARNHNVGIFSNTLLSDRMVSLILKLKHIADSVIIEYNLDTRLAQYCLVRDNRIFVRSVSKRLFKNTKLIIPIEKSNRSRLANLASFASRKNLGTSAYGELSEISITNQENLTILDIRIDSECQIVKFSTELARFLSNNDVVKLDKKEIIIDLTNFDLKHPLFKITDKSYSTLLFVKQCKRFFDSTIKGAKDYSSILTDFTELIGKQVDLNIGYIEIALSTYFCKSMFDYRPATEDDPYVIGKTQDDVITNSSPGTLLAFQGLHKAITNPSMYLMPKASNPFDGPLNIQPNVDIDKIKSNISTSLKKIRIDQKVEIK